MFTNYLEIALRLQALAQSGLEYTTNLFDRERYEEIRDLSVKMVALQTETPPEIIKNLFASEKGYHTPKSDIRAVIFKNGKLLFVKEKSDGRWSIPGGWADIGYTPSEVAAKEVFEEAGMKVEPYKLIGIIDKRKHPHPPSPYHTYKIFFLCRQIDSVMEPGLETSEVRFFGPDELPELSPIRITRDEIESVFKYLNDETLPPFFD